MTRCTLCPPPCWKDSVHVTCESGSRSWLALSTRALTKVYDHPLSSGNSQGQHVQQVDIRTQVIQCHARTPTSRWREVVPALEEMRSLGLVTDGRPYTVAIKALGDNGKTEEALKLLEVRSCCCCSLHRPRFPADQ